MLNYIILAEDEDIPRLIDIIDKMILDNDGNDSNNGSGDCIVEYPDYVKFKEQYKNNNYKSKSKSNESDNDSDSDSDSDLGSDDLNDGDGDGDGDYEDNMDVDMEGFIVDDRNNGHSTLQLMDSTTNRNMNISPVKSQTKSKIAKGNGKGKEKVAISTKLPLKKKPTKKVSSSISKTDQSLEEIMMARAQSRDASFNQWANSIESNSNGNNDSNRNNKSTKKGKGKGKNKESSSSSDPYDIDDDVFAKIQKKMLNNKKSSSS
jgi:hypothetical protein